MLVRRAHVPRHGPGQAVRLRLPDDRRDVPRTRAAVRLPLLLDTERAPFSENVGNRRTPFLRSMAGNETGADESALCLHVSRGAKLRIVSTTTSFGARTVASRIEVCPHSTVLPQLRVPQAYLRALTSAMSVALLQIWDVTHGRLCVSGVHNKMAPKVPTPTPTSTVGRAKL